MEDIDANSQDAKRLRGIFERWKITQKEKKLPASQEALAHELGMTQGAISQYLNGTMPLNIKIAAQLATCFRVDVEEISPRIAESLSKIKLEMTEENPDSPLNTNAAIIPKYDTGGSMGNGLILKEQPGVIENMRVSQEWLAQNIGRYTSAKNLCLVTGFGDSMKPMFNPGDPVMVDIGIKHVDHDGVFFFRIGNEGFIKRLQRIPGEGLIAMSENKAYREWTIKADMDFEVLGKVLKVWEGKDF